MTTEFFDVVIVGAGLSGIGAAYHLKDKCNHQKSYVILEGRDALGGTWDLFRYPGIRSDSDMHTLGYNFKPWCEAKAIADGPAILKYIQETAKENGIDKNIRYGHFVKKVNWSSKDVRWKVEAFNKNTESIVKIHCNFLLMCSGYYSYKEGFTPEFKGRESFVGEIIHPQKWPEDFESRGKKIVIVGSGATAMTLVPALAKKAEHVVMLQRSPTYVISRPDKDRIANFLRKILPERTAYAITRWKNVVQQQFFYGLTRRKPEKAKRWLLKMVRKELGDSTTKEHFTPSYNPWDQRLCLVPNSDLFHAIKSGKASVITDHIDTFTERGILLKSGKELEADVIITATGLNIVILGGITVSIDDAPIDYSKTCTYKGIMYSGIPNMVVTFGYINASWTLRSDITAEYACRLLNYMDEKQFRQCTPCLREQDKDMPLRPWIDDFSANYIQRVIHLFPKQGDRSPWTNPQNYSSDKKMFLHEPIEDDALSFS